MYFDTGFCLNVESMRANCEVQGNVSCLLVVYCRIGNRMSWRGRDMWHWTGSKNLLLFVMKGLFGAQLYPMAILPLLYHCGCPRRFYHPDFNFRYCPIFSVFFSRLFSSLCQFRSPAICSLVFIYFFVIVYFAIHLKRSLLYILHFVSYRVD